MSSDFASTLEQCLSQVESERARVQSCLVSYPTMAGELEPLLRTADMLRTAPKPQLSPEARAHITTLVFGRPEPAPRPQREIERRRWHQTNRLWAFAALGALLIFALLGGTGLAHTATDVLPGSVLYPVKRATEFAWLWITPERGEAALHLRLAERRLAETESLAQRGVVEQEVLEAMAGHVEGALGCTQGMAWEAAVPVLQAVVEFSSREEQTLADLMPRVPAAARDQLQTALQVCREQGRRAQGDIDARRPRPKEGLVPPGHGGQPPGQIATPPGQEVRPEGLQSPPGQEQIPPGQAKPDQDAEDASATDDKEDKEAEKEEKEEEKEAEKEEKEEEKEAEKEEKEEDKAAEEEENEAEEEEEEELEEETEEVEEKEEKDEKDKDK